MNHYSLEKLGDGNCFATCTAASIVVSKKLLNYGFPGKVQCHYFLLPFQCALITFCCFYCCLYITWHIHFFRLILLHIVILLLLILPHSIYIVFAASTATCNISCALNNSCCCRSFLHISFFLPPLQRARSRSLRSPSKCGSLTFTCVWLAFVSRKALSGGSMHGYQTAVIELLLCW